MTRNDNSNLHALARIGKAAPVVPNEFWERMNMHPTAAALASDNERWTLARNDAPVLSGLRMVKPNLRHAFSRSNAPKAFVRSNIG